MVGLHKYMSIHIYIYIYIYYKNQTTTRTYGATHLRTTTIPASIERAILYEATPLPIMGPIVGPLWGPIWGALRAITGAIGEAEVPAQFRRILAHPFHVW
jgi:hypothetical protein